jgi:iron(III) transport system substrate-binding protein
MKRRIFLVGGAALAAAACSVDAGGSTGAAPSAAASGAAGGGAKVLSLYTSSPKDQYEPAVAAFIKKTGITVDTVSAGTGELIKRIQAEGKNPLGDVQWGGLGAAITPAIDSFDEYVSANDAQTIADYQNAKGNKKLTAFSVIVNSLMTNNKLTAGITIDGWESLLNPALKGKIAFADPAKSSSSLSQIVNMLHSMGKGNPDNGWDYVGKFAKQLDGKMQGSSTNVFQMVASGEYAVGITNETNAVKYVASGADVKVVYPKEGNIVLADNIMLIKGAKNPASAKAFIDYLTSKEYQDTMEGVGLRTIRTDVTQKNFPAMSTIPVIKQDDAWMAKNGNSVKDKFTDLFTK